MTDFITWGKHPAYASGEWIKLFHGKNKADTKERKAQGFILRAMPVGLHPAKNPYPTYKGFGLRLINAEKAIKKLAHDRYADIYTRGFDNCFENGDGSAVVWALMQKAHAEPEDNAPLTCGIQIMFSTTLNGQKYPQCWLDTYEGKPPYGETLPQQPSLF